MMKKWGMVTIGAVAGLAIVSGCGNTGDTKDGAAKTNTGDAPKTAVTEPAKPVTITLFNGQTGAIDFDKVAVAAVQKKYPHVTLKIVKKDKGMDYPDWVTAKTPIDIVYESTAFTVSRIMQNGLQTDLDEQIKKNKFDLSIFEPNILAHARSTNTEGKLYGLPFSTNRYGLYYNKNLFDRAGAAYPKDGMTWDQVYDLTKKLTRVDNGTQIYGFTAPTNNLMLNNQLSLNQLEQNADKSAMLSDNWKLTFENLKRFFVLQNNTVPPTADSVKGNIAMVLDSGSMANAPVDFDWNVASVPELPQKPKTGLKPASLSLFLSSTSTQKDEAFKVMAYLVSDEFQTELTKNAVGTPLANKDVRNLFGQNLPQWKGKNVAALYYYPDAPALPARASNLVNVSLDFSKLFTQEGDSNTILRTFDEELNKLISEEKAKQGK